MTPKKKAWELAMQFRLKFDWTKDADKSIVKQCALLCVDEIIKEHELSFDGDCDYEIERIYIWHEIKVEIEKL